MNEKLFREYIKLRIECFKYFMKEGKGEEKDLKIRIDELEHIRELIE